MQLQNCIPFLYLAQNSPLNEEHWINIVASQAQSIQQQVLANADGLLTDLEHLISTQSLPFGSTSIYAQYRIFKKAHDHGFKVMLDGQGADEILGGYHTYIPLRIVSMLSNGHVKAALQLFLNAAKLPGSGGYLYQLYGIFDCILPSSLKGMARTLINKDLIPSYIKSDYLKDINLKVPIGRQIYKKDTLKKSLKKDILMDSLPQLLRYVDRNSMAFSVESRVPFLTPQLVSLVFSFPENFLIDNNAVTKSVFRQAMQHIVPSAILSRKDKIGFETPEAKWLKSISGWVEETFNNMPQGMHQIIDISQLHAYWNKFLTGKQPYHQQLWRTINLIKWVEAFNVTI